MESLHSDQPVSAVADNNQPGSLQPGTNGRKPLEKIFSDPATTEIARRIIGALATGFDNRNSREFTLRLAIERAYAADIKDLSLVSAYNYTRSMADFALASGMMNALEREGYVKWHARCLFGNIYFRTA